MRFAVRGTSFTFDGRYLSRFKPDADGIERCVACADLSLYLYDRPSCADAVRIATAMLTDPRFIGRS